MPKADVSLVIPTYNRLAMLREAIDSVRAQSLPPQEILVVDDGSTDETFEWLLAQSDILPLKQENKGPAAARNLGATRAHGQYLAFLDSDDLWLPKKLEVQTEFLAAHAEYQFCQSEELWFRDGLQIHPMKKHAKPSGWVFEACLERCLISPSGVMFRRDFFEELGGFDESFPVCEDYELWLRAALRSPFRTLAEPMLVKRGGHTDQLSHALWGMDRYRVRALEKLHNSNLLSEPQAQALKEELRRKLAILSTGFAKRHPSDPNPYQERLQCL